MPHDHNPAVLSIEPLRYGSYRPGHEVHFIRAKLSGQGVSRAGTATVDQLGWITVDVHDGDRVRLWNHHPERLTALLLTTGGRVELRERSVLGVPKADGSYLVSVGTEQWPCPSDDDSLEGISLSEVIKRRGGFTILRRPAKPARGTARGDAGRSRANGGAPQRPR